MFHPLTTFFQSVTILPTPSFLQGHIIIIPRKLSSKFALILVVHTDCGLSILLTTFFFYSQDGQWWTVEDVIILAPTNDACNETRRRQLAQGNNETSQLLAIPRSANNKEMPGEMEVAEDGMETPMHPRDLQRYYGGGRNPYGRNGGKGFGGFTKGGGRARPGGKKYMMLYSFEVLHKSWH
jgi:hypothetical protein